MKVLHVIPTLNPRGGGPMEGVVQMARVNRQQGFDIHVVCFDEINDEHLNDLPLTVHPLGHGVGKYAYQPKLYSWLIENLPNYDAVVINGIWQYHSYCTWRAIQRVKVPYFVYTHGMMDPWFKQNYPIKHLKKWLYWPWADYRVLRDATAVLFTCEEERLLAPKTFWLYSARERVVKYGAATPPSNSEVMLNAFFDKFPNVRGKRSILFLSRIHEKKGCDLLIQAFARVANDDPSLHLIMAGPDSNKLKSRLEVLANKLGVSDKITWTGMLRGDLKWGAFFASEAFALPSHQENFGIAVAEALGCGLPVLISNKVNIWREIVADGAGIVGEDNLIGTEKSLREWLSKSISQRQEMGVQARTTFEQRYTIKQMADSLLHAIEDGISSPH